MSAAERQIDSSRADYYLTLWRDWMRSHSSRIGYPSHSAGFSSGGISCWDDLAESVDGYAVRAADAAIDSLTPIHRAVLCHVYLQAVFRFRVPLELALPAAQEAFMGEMRKRGVE